MGDGFDAVQDATRRTRLANERTHLAWWRTGLTTFAVSLAAGKLVPELSSGASWPYQAIGVGFGVVGLLFIAYAYLRQKQVDDALVVWSRLVALVLPQCSLSEVASWYRDRQHGCLEEFADLIVRGGRGGWTPA